MEGNNILTLSVPISDKEKKIKLHFYFHTSFFIKPFEAAQRSVKIKIQLNFYFNITVRNARDIKG